MYYLNPVISNVYKSDKPSFHRREDGTVLKDLLVEDPPYDISICKLVDMDVRNTNNTYGKWVLDVEKAKEQQIEHIKQMWEKEFTLPLATPYGIFVQQAQIDLNNFRDGILNTIIMYAQENTELFTADELTNLEIGTLLGSVYEKCKEVPMVIRDYYNKLHDINIETARNLAMIMANAISSSYYKKWQLQEAIEQLSEDVTYEQIMSYRWEEETT